MTPADERAAEARRQAEEYGKEIFADACPGYEWPSEGPDHDFYVMIGGHVADAIAQAVKEQESEDRRLLARLGLVWAGTGYTIDLVYKLDNRPAITRPLPREINNAIAERFRR